MWLAVGVVVTAVAAGALLHFYRTQTAWVESAPWRRVSKGPAHTLVVVYSRTGNTLGAAKQIARYFDADLLRIEAPQYGRTLRGLRLGGAHADAEVTTTPIEHDPVDLSRYDLVFLCSPTWWFRPAPPLWSFVEQHNFYGKAVFLLMTGNSRLTEERTAKFVSLVAERNGSFVGKLFVRRGRVFWQKSPQEVEQEVREALDERRRLWPEGARIGSALPSP